MATFRCLTSFALLVALCNGHSFATGLIEEVHQLQPPDTTGSNATAINNHGQVLVNAGGTTWLFDGDTYTELELPSNAASGSISGLNDNGLYIGGYVTEWPPTVFTQGRAFIYDGITHTQIYGPTSSQSVSASFINNHGVIGGSYTPFSDYSKAFLYDGDAYTTFPFDSSYLLGLSDTNAAIVSGATMGVSSGVYYYDGNSLVDLTDAWGTGDEVGGSTISNSGVVAGFFYDSSNNNRLTLITYDGDNFQVIGDPAAHGVMAAIPRAINNKGWIVSDRWVYDGEQFHSLVDVLTDAGYQGFTFVARDMNDAGQIVGMVQDTTGRTWGVLLNPIPEPSSMLLVGAGAALLLRRRPRAACGL